MADEIRKSEPSPDDVLAAIQSFNDPSIITNIFRELGWSYSLEIKETLIMAKQNANLSIKFKAIKHLRELLREAAETSGYIANISSTTPNPQGGHTTFSAKRIAGILNPAKQIESTEIKETQNDKSETEKSETKHHTIGEKSNRGSDRQQNQTEGTRPENEVGTRHSDIRPESSEPERDTGRAFPAGDADLGGTEPPDGGETSREVSRTSDSSSKENSKASPGRDDSCPCIKTRPPTCDQDLFSGISSAED